MSRNKLYSIIAIACLGGYIWLYTTHSRYSGVNAPEVGMCIIKKVTTLPCPSCGTTRSVISLIKGEWIEAIYTNPMGLIVLFIMLAAPIWMAIDILTRKESLLKIYLHTEAFFRQKKVAIPAIIIVISNWIWNITKGY